METHFNLVFRGILVLGSDSAKGSKNAMILAAQTEKRDHELLKAMVPFQSRTDRPALTVITHAESHVTSMEAAEE